MTTTALLWKMNELYDDTSSNPQNFERESSHASSSFEDCEERKQKRKEVAIFVKVLLDYLERANELDLKQLTKNVSNEEEVDRCVVVVVSCLSHMTWTNQSAILINPVSSRLRNV
jgi:hypothetical protein